MYRQTILRTNEDCTEESQEAIKINLENITELIEKRVHL